MKNKASPGTEDEYICPDCGNVIVDLNSYCSHCRRARHYEKERKRLIHNDLGLSRLDHVCKNMKIYRNIFFCLLIPSSFIYGVLYYTKMMASVCFSLQILLYWVLGLFITCGILNFCLHRLLIHLSEKKLHLKGDFYL